MHATDLLDAPPADPAPFAVAFGPSSFLKRAVREALVGSLTAEDPDAAPSVYAGDDVDAAHVLDEVSTVSMFGGGRVVVVESADKFVTNHRPTLEAYAAKAKPGSLLLLEVEKFPKTTKLYKALAKPGLLVECADLAGGKLNAWLRKQATSRFEKTLPAPAAAAMIELVGEDLTLLSQELAKLDSYAGDRPELTVEDVAAVVGGWRTQTTFELLAAVRQGDLERAIAQLGKLLDTGES
ncbi:MAG: DNA polymerase III subunit delta, partial [Planctomycetota bacterium]